MSDRRGAEHYGAEIRESTLEKAERRTSQELRKLGWDEEELERRRKGDPQKIKIALCLRQETTMTLAWVASRLKMGTKTHLAHLLYWQGRERKQKIQKWNA